VLAPLALAGLVAMSLAAGVTVGVTGTTLPFAPAAAEVTAPVVPAILVDDAADPDDEATDTAEPADAADTKDTQDTAEPAPPVTTVVPTTPRSTATRTGAPTTRATTTRTTTTRTSTSRPTATTRTAVPRTPQALQARDVVRGDRDQPDLGGERLGLSDREYARSVPPGAEVVERGVVAVADADVVDDHERAAGAQRAGDPVEERRRRIAVHERLDGEGQVEAGHVVGQRGEVGHRTAHAAPQRAAAGGVAGRQPDLRGADRDPDDLHRPPPREVQRGRADPATEVEHAPVAGAELVGQSLSDDGGSAPQGRVIPEGVGV
jgi:hypothetical protein